MTCFIIYLLTFINAFSYISIIRAVTFPKFYFDCSLYSTVILITLSCSSSISWFKTSCVFSSFSYILVTLTWAKIPEIWLSIIRINALSISIWIDNSTIPIHKIIKQFSRISYADPLSFSTTCALDSSIFTTKFIIFTYGIRAIIV